MAPKKFIKRVFDAQVWCQESDAAHLVKFVGALIGLPRKTFLAVMRAIRTYVTALHRLGDDAELAYTLFVASIESLAQAFDGHRAEWRDYAEEKRKAVDTALSGALEDISDRVRAALLEIEHVSLGRRFRDFALAHIEPAYFRSEAADQEHPVGRSELPDALRQAYQLRSGYVHNLDELPKILAIDHGFADTTRVGQTTEPDAKRTDLGPLLTTVEPMLPTMKAGERLPFLALYFLFNWIVPPPQRSANLEDIWKRYGAELNKPSVESLLIHLVRQKMPDWPVGDHRKMHDDYFRRRDRGNGLRLARSLEARLTLTLAERYRADGDPAAARHLVSFAVENHPGHKPLEELETAFTPDQPIDWRDEHTRQAAAKAGDEPAC